MQDRAQDKNPGMNRRQFVSLTATTALGFSIVPRHVLGGSGYIAPSDKITLAYIGMGTQGIRELLPLLTVPEIQVVAVCDPNKEARGYRDWNIHSIKNEVRKALNKPDWNPGGDNTIPGGL
ncbi:MAG TPA: gfo/Idh/MocA family oxidoreductase, partial [Chitinophagaceae bacterium]|nr:gfo/Idh/MocA family oxidoreductase [Chitinophagaceae bacterium]